MPEPTVRKPKFLYNEYASGEEWDARPPLPPPDRPISIPREWAGHACIGLAVCIMSSRDGCDLDAMERVMQGLLDLYPDLVDDIPYLWRRKT